MHPKAVEITEGHTRLLVPARADGREPSQRDEVFFNPRARLNRDLSMVAYTAFLDSFEGPRLFLEGLSGLGARGLRVANEVPRIGRVVLNDLNQSAMGMARQSAQLNGLDDIGFSGQDACVFLGSHSVYGKRGAIVDIDPFGTPARFLDCCVRAVMHKGMLSLTATDLRVLGGLFPESCQRRYGGTPIRVEFGNEVAIRLILGCLRHITARLGMSFEPLFVESDQHYYRAYVRVLNRRDVAKNMGFLFHCTGCGQRGVAHQDKHECDSCGKISELAGPLWTGRLFEGEFLERMEQAASDMIVDKSCSKIISKCILESDMPPAFYTLDEVASRLHSTPTGLERAVGLLRKEGFCASPTSLGPTGFRTDAPMGEMARILASKPEAHKV